MMGLEKRGGKERCVVVDGRQQQAPDERRWQRRWERPDKGAECYAISAEEEECSKREGNRCATVEEGKQGESVYLCFLSSMSRFVHSLPGPVDVMLHPSLCTSSTEKIDQYRYKTQELTI